jgi:hypothetical protein
VSAVRGLIGWYRRDPRGPHAAPRARREEAEFPQKGWPRVEPRFRYIWLHADGRWREAHINRWVHDRARD